jgi:hypothetical protein
VIRARIFPVLIALLSAAIVCCGRETIDLAAATDAGCADAKCSPLGDGSSVCRENGIACTQATECCSSRCESNVCLASGACAAPATPCSSRGSCCGGRCEPLGLNAILVCSNYCVANGGACDSAQKCCALACNEGVCGGASCQVAGDSCSIDADCCWGSCRQNQCQSDANARCRPSGESCDDAGGPPCCSNVCNPRTNRCDLGAGSCREPGTPCIQDGDCCRGTCAQDINGTPVCTASCLPTGAACNSDGDCCNGGCAGTPLTCGAGNSGDGGESRD